MKRLISILISILILAFTVPSWADWTLTTTEISDDGYYLKWKTVCTSDGSALSATDILATNSAIDRKTAGQTLMAMKVSPGTGGVIPNTTINITLTDAEGDTLWSDTGISKDAVTWHDMSADIDMYPPVIDELNLAINDIGDSGDQVTLYFITWQERD